MDETTDSRFKLTWNAKVGDLVRVRKYPQFQESGKDEYEYAYGIIVEIYDDQHNPKNQGIMFASAEIKFLKENRTMIIPAGHLEVVSGVK